MEELGFGPKWRRWIEGCQSNARASILVNGVPTDEFEMGRGLRQGDPMSPFLFILAIEGFHAVLQKAVQVEVFKPAYIGDDGFRVSNLLYVDDIVFMGEWSTQNVTNLIGLLRCFYVISGLKINVSKSKILGLGVDVLESRGMAEVLGCGVADLPFSYLGVPVGCNMSRVNSWKPVVDKFKAKLSTWKARSLSVGGRLLLLKAVLGNLPTYYMSICKIPVAVEKTLEALRRNFFLGGELDEKKMTWVAWRKCLAKTELGGLGIGSIFAFNRALLFKWVWRFRCQPNDLWARVTSNVYGIDGRIGEAVAGSAFSPWISVLKSTYGLLEKGVDLLGCRKRQIGDGSSIRFWQETWLGSSTLKDRFPRNFALETVNDCMVVDRVAEVNWLSILRRQPRGGIEEAQMRDLREELNRVILCNKKDGWVWENQGAFGYTAASGRDLIDVKVLEVDTIATRWSKLVPTKVNVFAWCLGLNRIPTKVNLDNRGLDLGSVLCSICESDMAMTLWEMVGR